MYNNFFLQIPLFNCSRLCAPLTMSDVLITADSCSYIWMPWFHLIVVITFERQLQGNAQSCRMIFRDFRPPLHRHTPHHGLKAAALSVCKDTINIEEHDLYRRWPPWALNSLLMRQSHNSSRQHSAFQSLISLMLIYLLKFATSTEITIRRTQKRGKIQVKRTGPRSVSTTSQRGKPGEPWPSIVCLSISLVHCLNSVLILFDRDQQYHGISQTCTLNTISITSSSISS